MIRFNHKHNHTRKSHLYRLGVCLFCIAVLAASLPREKTMKYSYHKQQVWEDAALIAQDSFPVLKSEEELQSERDSLHRYYEPYFEWNKAKQVEMVNKFETDFRQQHSETVPSYYKTHITEKLVHIYQQGIMESADYDKLLQEDIRQIRLYQQNESESRSTDLVFTEKTAYEYLMTDEDTSSYRHSVLQKCNLSLYLTPNLSYDLYKSQQQKAEVDGMLVPYKGQVQVGQKIVDRGQVVDDYTYLVLRSLEKHTQEHSMTTVERLMVMGGQTTYICILMVLLFLYFLQFRNDYLERVRTMALVISLVLIFPILTYLLVAHDLMSVYVIPYCMVPIFIRIFMDSRTAFITHLITILLCAMALHSPYIFIVTETVAGLTAIYSLRQLSRRSELFQSMVIVVLATILTYFCMELIKGTLTLGVNFDKWTYIYITMAGVLSLLSYLLLIPIERIFGFTSIVTLVELSDTNNPLLRRLSEEAPGTFQHSMQVANLAAEVANHIGGESQLVRTGALYHDIGKLDNAVFFTENQSGTNPHNALPIIQSAQIIIRHVQDGLALADKYKLPQVIKDFISTHHGKSMAKYFYISYKNAFPGSQIDETLFTYPGPNPHTLEQAILMMADSVEAASRSLKEYTEESISDMVDKIINGIVEAGYIKDCPITFLDIEETKEVFKSKLRTIYHTRIQYPEQNFTK